MRIGDARGRQCEGNEGSVGEGVMANHTDNDTGKLDIPLELINGLCKFIFNEWIRINRTYIVLPTDLTVHSMMNKSILLSLALQLSQTF